MAIQWDSSDSLKRTSDGKKSRLIHAETSQLSLSSCTETDEVVPHEYSGNHPWLVFLDTSHGRDQWHDDFTVSGANEGDEESRYFRLSSMPTSNVTVIISDESDTPAQLNFSTTTLTFTPINWCQIEEVTFEIVDNNTVDDYKPETAAKAIFKPTGGGIYQGIIGGQYFLHWNNIKDDEQNKAGLIVKPTRLNMKEEETKPFTVKLAWQPSSTVTVTVPDVPPFYLSHDKDTLKFSSENWNTEREVMATVGRDPDRNWITRNASYNLIAKGSGYDGKVKKIEVAITNSDLPIMVEITNLPQKINSKDKLTAGFKFSQDVTEFDTTDVKVRNGIKGTFAGGGSNYTLDITPKGNENVIVTVIANAATNGSNRGPTKKETFNIEWDDTAPSVEIMGLPVKINSINPLTAIFTFTEAVMGFEKGDITVTGGNPGTLSGSGENYSLVITPTGSADVVVTVRENAASDGLNTGPYSSEVKTVVWDNDVPNVQIGGLPFKINSRDSLTATFIFTEAVQDIDVTVRGGKDGAISGLTPIYPFQTMEIIPYGNTDVVVTVAKDAMSDGLNTGPPKDVTKKAVWDNIKPEVIITGLPEKINSTSQLTATFEFTEDVRFRTSGVRITTGKKGKFERSDNGAFPGSGKRYTLEIIPVEDKNLEVTIGPDAATDGLNFGPTSRVSKEVLWDDISPNVTITGLPDKINTTTDQTATFTFSEDVTDFVSGDVSVTGGDKGTFTATSATVYTLVITSKSGKDLVVTVAKDAATDGLNTGPATAQSHTSTWDAAVPTVTISGLTDRHNMITDQKATFTFNEHVRDFIKDDITVAGGTKGTFEGGGKRYALVITPISGQNLVVTVPKDAANAILNNAAGPASAVSDTSIWDATGPMVTISGLSDRHNTTTDQTATFTFSEGITGFDTTDIDVTGGSAGTFSATSATVYTLVITPTSGEDLVVTIAKDVATDGLNTGPATDQSHTSTWDNTAPTVTITGLSTKHKTTSDQTATFTFNEDVTGFVTADVTVTGGTKKTFTGSGSVYTLVITPTSGEDLVVIVAKDAANDDLNNAGPANAEVHTSTWDAIVPTVTISGLSDLHNTTTDQTATFTFSEDVTGFVKGDIDVTGGSAGTFSATSATVYTLVITPTSGENLVVTVAKDAATDGLNAGPAAAQSHTSTWDTTAPTVEITGLPKKINSKDPLTAIFTFSEDVTGFDMGSVRVDGGTKGAFAPTSKTVYTLVITPMENTNLVVTVNANVATDGLNTGPSSAVTETVIWDSNVPNVTISGLPAKINTTNSLMAIFEFNEAVTGFEVGDIKVSGATPGTFTANTTTTYSLQILPSGSGNVVVTVEANAAYDGINTGPADLVSFTSVWDGDTPGVTLSGVPEKINSRTSFTVTFTFSEDVTGFIKEDVGVTGAAKGVWSVRNATTYTLLVTPSGTQDVVITVSANVATDGTNTGPATPVTATAIWDATPPTVAIGGLPERITTTDPQTVTFTFSEEVTGFVSADVEVTAATKSTFTGSEKFYTLILTPTGSSDVVVKVIANAATDGINTGPRSPATATAIWDSKRIVTLTVNEDEVLEGESVQVSVNLSGAPFSSATIIPLIYPPPPLTGDDTATESDDYTRLPSITIPAGKEIGTGSIVTIDDDVYERDEKFEIALGSLPDDVTRGDPASQTITIQDQIIVPTVTLSAVDDEVTEGHKFTVIVTVSKSLLSAVRIPLTLTPLTAIPSQDYHIPSPLEVIVPAGDTDSDIMISTIEDKRLEEDEAFRVALGNLPPTVEGSDEIVLTIEDDETAEILTNPASSIAVVEGGSNGIQVYLSAAPWEPVNVTMTGYSEPLRMPSPPSLTFTSLNWGDPQEVTLTADTDLNSTNETRNLILKASGGGFEITTPLRVTITDRDEAQEDDDERPDPIFLFIQDKSVIEDQKQVQVDVKLSRAINEVVSVEYESSDGTAQAESDYTASRGIVIFDPLATQGVIQFEIEDDGIAEPEGETFDVTLTNATTNVRIRRETATVTILDPAPASILRIEDATVTENEQSVLFHIHVSPPSVDPITIRYQTEDGTAKAGEDYEAKTGVLEFTPAMEMMTLEIPLMGDEVNWHTETFTVRLSTSEPILIEKAVATATINDDIVGYIPNRVFSAYTARFLRTSASEIMEGLGNRLKDQPSICSAASRSETARLWHSTSSWDPSLGELLGGCHLTSKRGSIHLWGRGGYRRFTGQREDDLTVKGDVSTAMAGVDYRWHSGWLTGVLVSHGQGNGSFKAPGTDGQIQGSITGLYPYLAYQREAWKIWGTTGLGSGHTESFDLTKHSWRAWFGAIGLQGVMTTVKVVDLRYYGDVLMTSTKINHQRIGVVRIRAGMEASAQLSSELYPYLDASVRQDAGSAEEGLGLELGAGMRVQVPVLHLKGAVRAQQLIVHTADGFTEWGVSGSLEFGNHKKGLQLMINPSWGPSHSRSLYRQQTIHDATPTLGDVYRTEMELRYGIPMDETVIRTIMGVTTFEQGTMYRLGGQLQSWGQFSVSTFGIVHTTDSHHLGVNIRGLLKY